jgi:glycosyltransferase involved in cell wall biosynthesis
MGTYNDAAVLPETLESVLSQTFKDFEFVVVNDGSTDPLVSEVLENYAQSDARIRVCQKQNEGLTRALIAGCEIAQGRYIARVDSGDSMLPERLETQIKVLEQNKDCAFVSSWTEFCGPCWEQLWLAKGAPVSTEPVSLLTDDPKRGLKGNVPHHGSVMFRKSVYKHAGGYRPEFYCGQDWDLWYRLAELGTYQVVPQVLYRARFFPGSISMTRKRYQDEAARCSLAAFVARRLGEDESRWLRRAQVCRPGLLDNDEISTGSDEPGYYFIGEALRRRGDARARHYLAQAIRQAPTSPRAYVRWFQSWLSSGSQAA